MKKLLTILLPCLGLFLAIPAHAQYTSVTATVTDPNGAVYINCSVSAVFVPSPTATQSPTFGNPTQTFPLTITGASCNSFGTFTLTLADNNLVVDGHTGGQQSEWKINICTSPGQVAGGPLCFSYTSVVTGASEDLSAALKAASVIIPVTNVTGIQVGTAGDLMKYGTTTTATDSGIVAANVGQQTGGINGNLLKATGANTSTDSGVAVSNVPTLGGNNAYTGDESHIGTESFNNIETTLYADQFTGSDMCAKIVTAMTAIQNSSLTSGEIRVPAGTFVCTTQLLVPNNGAAIPLQKSFKLVGAGSGGLGEVVVSTPPIGGTILDMQYNASTAKIDTRGVGRLEIEGISFEDTASDATPFIFTTNTALHIHDNQFWGNCADATKQTVFVLGGTTTTVDGSPTSPFQGYGTVIRDNEADCIGEFALLQVYANAISIISNSIFINSGLAAGAAIEINSNSTNAGNYIAFNLFEMFNYKYGINLVKNSQYNSIIGNSCFDPGGGSTGCVNVQASASNYGNVIIPGNSDSPLPPISGQTYGLGVSSPNDQCVAHSVSTTNNDECLLWMDNSNNIIIGPHPNINSYTLLSGRAASDSGPAIHFLNQSFFGGCNGTATSSSTLYIGGPNTGTPTCTDTGVATLPLVMTSAGTITNLVVKSRIGGFNASSGVFTITKNGLPQAVTCTIGTGDNCNDLINSFTVVAGDLILVQYTTQATETLGDIAFSFEKQ